jgi:hypothetical protein
MSLAAKNSAALGLRVAPTSLVFDFGLNLAKYSSTVGTVVCASQAAIQLSTGHSGEEAAFTFVSGVLTNAVEMVVAAGVVAEYGAALGAFAGPIGLLAGLAIGFALGVALSYAGNAMFSKK